MNETEFARLRRPAWQALEATLTRLELRQPVDVSSFPDDYRRLCHDLALARQRLYGSALIDALNALALRCHQQLYTQRGSFLTSALQFFRRDFPQLLRARWRRLLLAGALFYVPFVAFPLVGARYPIVTHALLGREMMQSLEQMYDPHADHPGRPRDANSNLAAFAFYIWNNVGIAFRTFAGGLVFGVGAILVMVHNGLFLGAATAYINEVGYGSTFYPFVAGHSAFELNALILSGMAGLELGLALVHPGPWRRGDALRRAARPAVQILYGAACLLVVAAFIDAFWSGGSGAPTGVKYAVGATLWVILAFYVILAGRRRAA